MNLFFAAESAAPLAAETIFSLGGFGLTNAMLYGLVTAAFVLTLFMTAARATQLWPKSKLAFYAESLVELIIGIATESFGSREKALKHLPLLITLFVFILACNLSGLLPGVGTIYVNTEEGQASLFRAFTTDLNATLAMAIISLTTVQVYAIKELGLWGHFMHYFHNKPLKPMNMFVGINELIGELIRLVTLSLRLFGVIYGGEALLHAISNLAGNFAWAATFPIMFLEIFFAFVQAYLFMMLTATYLAMATSPVEEH